MENLILFKSEDCPYELNEMKNHTAQRMKCNFAQLTIIPYNEKLQ